MKPRVVAVREKKMEEKAPPDEEGWTVLETGGPQATTPIQDGYKASDEQNSAAAERKGLETEKAKGTGVLGRIKLFLGWR